MKKTSLAGKEQPGRQASRQPGRLGLGQVGEQREAQEADASSPHTRIHLGRDKDEPVRCNARQCAAQAEVIGISSRIGALRGDAEAQEATRSCAESDQCCIYCIFCLRVHQAPLREARSRSLKTQDVRERKAFLEPADSARRALSRPANGSLALRKRRGEKE